MAIPALKFACYAQVLTMNTLPPSLEYILTGVWVAQ